VANPGFLRSTDGSDADTGATWALANATMTGAVADAAAGNTIYVSDNHAESTAAGITLASPGTPGAPLVVLCVDDTGDPNPPTVLAATGTITTTGNSSITRTGCTYNYGIILQCGTGAVSPSILMQSGGTWWEVFEQCKLRLVVTGATASITFASSTILASRLEFVNTTVRFGATGQRMAPGRTNFLWRGGGIEAGGTVPTTLFIGASSGGLAGTYEIIGCDFSLVVAGKNLVDVATNRAGGVFIFTDCKWIGGNVTVGTHAGPGGSTVRALNCHSGDVVLAFYEETYLGTSQNTSTPRLDVPDGADDGATPFEMMLSPSANVGLFMPLKGQPIMRWNDVEGSAITLSVHTFIDRATALTDAEVWLEVYHLGTSGVPQAVHVTDRRALLAASAAQPASGATWNNAATNPQAQILAVTVTPQERGYLVGRVCVAVPSVVVTADPQLHVS